MEEEKKQPEAEQSNLENVVNQEQKGPKQEIKVENDNVQENNEVLQAVENVVHAIVEHNEEKNE